MKRLITLLTRWLRREPAPLPTDPFGEPGGPVTPTQTVDSVALSQLHVNKMRAG